MFDKHKHAFWLLAVIIGAELLLVIASMGSCLVMIISENQQIGACKTIREDMFALLAGALAIGLALLNGGSSPPPKE